jgi:HK97 gp10 family phage protein
VIVWTKRSRIPQVMAAVARGGEVAAQRTRETIRDEAQARAPVLTGELRDSVEVQGEDVTVGAVHGGYVEFGTRFMPAQPFFTPAVDAGAKAFETYIGAVFRGL